MDVIEKLNQLRLSKNMSVYRLAELSGINQSTLANTFSRKTVPSIKNLEIICEALGLTLSQFFAENESKEILTEEEKNLVVNFRRLPKTVKLKLGEAIAEISINCDESKNHQ